MIIEFDEDGTFHTKKLSPDERKRFAKLSTKEQEECKPQYMKKWENYNHILQEAYKSGLQICLLRVDYGRNKKSCGLTGELNFIKEINDFKDTNSVNVVELMLNNCKGALDEVVIKTLNYIDQSEDISGKIILIHYNGNDKKIRCGIISGDKVSKVYQGSDYMLSLGWNVKGF